MSLLLLFDDFIAGESAGRTTLDLSEPLVRTHRLLFEHIDPVEVLRFGLDTSDPEVRTHLLLLSSFEEPPAGVGAVAMRGRGLLVLTGGMSIIPPPPTGQRITITSTLPTWDVKRPNQ